MKMPLALTAFLLVLFSLATARTEKFTQGAEQRPLTPELRSGDYVWKPEVSPAGPVVIIISLSEQDLYVYRNGVRIGRSTISSGKSGHRTPTGVFTILEKNVKHHSSIYKGASMPYMERITWGGVAMHAGHLPGYPASHGCIRLPVEFAQKLYTVTSRGTTVLVTDGRAKSGLTAHPGLLFAGINGASAEKPSFFWKPEKAPTGPVSIILSTADEMAHVFRNGVEIGRAPVKGPRSLSGNYAYTALSRMADGSYQWQSLGGSAAKAPDLKQFAQQLVVASEFLAEARSVIMPGSTLIVTDQPVNETTRSSPGFKILTTEPLQ